MLASHPVYSLSHGLQQYLLTSRVVTESVCRLTPLVSTVVIENAAAGCLLMQNSARDLRLLRI